MFLQNEREQSTYNFELANIDHLFQFFTSCEQQAQALVDANCALPAYEQVLKASHTFNLLDARHAISVSERQRFILRVRKLAQSVAHCYYDSREQQDFPMATPETIAKFKKRFAPKPQVKKA